MAPERIGVREVRQNLSKFLERVKRGERFEITEYGHPVAVLGPLPQSENVINRLEAEGRIVRRGHGNLADLPPPLKWDGPPTSQILDELREDRI